MEPYRPLVITNLSAKDLADMRHFGRMMVYAVASVTGGPSSAGHKLEFTTALDTRGERNPKWNTRIQFNLHNPSFQNNCLSLHIHFYCRLTSTDDKYLGGVKVPAKSLVNMIISRNMSTSAFHHVQYPVVSSSRGEQGFVQFSFAFPHPTSRPQPPTWPQRSQHPQLRQPVPQRPGPSQRPFSHQPRQQPPSHPPRQQFPLRQQPPRLRPSHQPFHPPPPRLLPSQTQLFPQRPPPPPPQSSQSRRRHIVSEQPYEVSVEQMQGLRISQPHPTYNQPNGYNATAHSNVNGENGDDEEEEEEEEEGGQEYAYGNVEGYGNYEDSIRNYGDEDNKDGDEEKKYNYGDGDDEDEEEEDEDYRYYDKGY